MSILDVGGTGWDKLFANKELIHMGHNCNQLPIDPLINEVMIETIRNNEYRNYPPPYGLDELRDLISADVGVTNKKVLITNGSTEAIYSSLNAILRPNDQVIVSDPAWPHIGNFARELGAEVIQIPVYDQGAGYKITPDAIRANLGKQTRLIAIIDPLNPLGSSYTEDEIRAICELAKAHGAYVLHDSTYRDFVTGQHFPAINYYERAIVTVSLSKSCGFAGLRLGAVIANDDLFDKICEKQVSKLGVNIVVQRGAVAAYRTKQKWLPVVMNANRRHQKLLWESIKGIPGFNPVVYPSSGNFLAIDTVETGSKAERIVRMALDCGFIIRSGAYTSDKLGDRFIRITTTVPSEYVERFCEVFPAHVARALSARTA